MSAEITKERLAELEYQAKNTTPYDWVRIKIPAYEVLAMINTIKKLEQLLGENGKEGKS